MDYELFHKRRNRFLQVALFVAAVSPAFLPDDWVLPAVGTLSGVLLIAMVVHWTNRWRAKPPPRAP
jgi:hypothetical protein